MRAVLVVWLCVACVACQGGGASSQVVSPVETVASLQACLARMGAGPLAVGTDNRAIPGLDKPRKGDVFADPVYQTCLVRATAHDIERPKGFARSDYSRRQAFNADNSRFIVYAFDGYWHLYDGNTFAWLGELVGPASDAEPQWHPTDPDLLYYLPTVGAGMLINELNVVNGRSKLVGDLADRIIARWPTANAAWTRSEGSPSADARYWAFQVDDVDFQGLGFLVWDRDDDRIVAWRDTRNRPDHLSMSPSGNHVVVSFDDGTIVYDRNLANERLLQKRSEHSDLAIGPDGHDVYVSIDYGSNAGWIFMTDLVTGKRTDLVRTYIEGTATAMHFSGKAFGRPGWVLVSTYAGYPKQAWLHDKIFAMELKADPRIVTLAHHRARPTGYWAEPHATASRDFTRVLFNSNWGIASETDIDAYLIRIPGGALPTP